MHMPRKLQRGIPYAGEYYVSSKAGYVGIHREYYVSSKEGY